VISRITRKADLIFTVSEFTKSRLMELCGVAAERVAIVGNGVSPPYFANGCSDHDCGVLNRFNLEAGAYVVAVGSLTWRKGGDVLLDVARILAERRSPLRMVVAGRRHDTDLVQRLATMKHGQPDLPIELVGYVGDAELAALLRRALALIFPSRYEGFGIPVIEAMAAGAPVISSRAAALPEVVGTAGLFVDTHAAPDWADAIVALERDSVQREALIAAGKERARAYTWDACARRLVDALRG
jgi:glycosyltransferase involved in cell wall biosynthesis